MDVSLPDIQAIRFLLETALDDPKWLPLDLSVADVYIAMSATEGTRPDINEAIVDAHTVLDRLPKDAFEWHWDLGNLYGYRYIAAEKGTDLELAAHHLQQSLYKMPTDYPELMSRCRTAIWLGEIRYEKLSRAHDLETWLQSCRLGLYHTPPDDPEYPDRLWNLGSAYAEKHETTGQQDYLERAISLVQRSLEKMSEEPAKSLRRAIRLNSLASYHNILFGITQAVKDLDATITWRNRSVEAVRQSSDATSFLSSTLTLLASDYRRRYRLQGSLTDLDQSIRAYNDACRQGQNPAGDKELLKILEGLYESRYQRTESILDLERAIQYGKELAMTSDEGDSESAEKRERYLQAKLRFSYDGGAKRMMDIESVIQTLRDLVDDATAVPAGHPDRPGYLRDLAHFLIMRSHETHALADIDMAIQLLVEVSDDGQGETPPSVLFRPGVFAALRYAYSRRHNLTREIEDINLAIKWGLAAVEILADGDDYRPGALVELAACYEYRYELSYATSDLDESVRLSQQALDVLPTDYDDRANVFHRAGRVCEQRFIRNETLADAERCIHLYQQALQALPDQDPSRTDHHVALGWMYSWRYIVLGSSVDADKAATYLKERLQQVPDECSEHAEYLRCLCRVYRSRYLQMGQRKDLDLSVGYGYQVFDHPSSSATERVQSGQHLFFVLSLTEDWGAAYQIATRTMALLPRIIPRSLSNADKQTQLEKFLYTAMGSQAAAISLLASQSPLAAVQLLELGRAFIIGSLGELRMDVSDLARAHPVLAEEYLALRDRLDTPIKADISVNRHEIARKFDRVLDDIRQQPGFERFLLPVGEGDLKKAAAWGPVVVINSDTRRCDALIIRKDTIHSLHLPRLRYDDIMHHARQFTVSALQDASLLEWLWVTVAEPILSFLGLTETPQGEWCRVWWIPTGPLARLPIHAAGYHGDDSGNTVLDRVISSYSSSIKTLLQSRQSRHDEGSEKAQKAVLVGMDRTPGQANLHSVLREIDKVASLCSEMKLPAVRPLALCEEVISEIRDCSIFHFAGHGRNDAGNPSQSALLFLDGSLTVSALFDINLHNRKPFLAYLSACGTGQTRQRDKVDEGLHLISAYQTAGFRHVVGSLCEVDDTLCEKVAEEVYRRIKAHGMTDRSVCEALHHASRKFRDEWVADTKALLGSARLSKAITEAAGANSDRQSETDKDMRNSRDVVSADDGVPAHWAPYVHFGA